MNIKRVKRKCGVRGCKNTVDVFALSRNREKGNSVIVCKECLREALKAAETYKEPEKVEKKKKTQLFFHPELMSEQAEPPKAETEPPKTTEQGEVKTDALREEKETEAEKEVKAAEKTTNSNTKRSVKK